MKGKGFIVEYCSMIFGFLGKISVFSVIRRFRKTMTYTFVDAWVLGNFFAAILLTLLGYYLGDNVSWLMYLTVGYAILRVFEIIIYQINMLLFDPYRTLKKGKEYIIKSPTRTVILLLHNYIEVMFWYAAMIIALQQLNGITLVATYTQYIQSCILCIATFNGDLIQNIVGELPGLSDIIFLQVITGVIMTLISLARFIGILPSVVSIEN